MMEIFLSAGRMAWLLLVLFLHEATSQCIEESFYQITAAQTPIMNISCAFAMDITASRLGCALHCFEMAECCAFVIHNNSCLVCADGNAEATLGLLPVTLNGVHYNRKLSVGK